VLKGVCVRDWGGGSGLINWLVGCRLWWGGLDLSWWVGQHHSAPPTDPQPTTLPTSQLFIQATPINPSPSPFPPPPRNKKRAPAHLARRVAGVDEHQRPHALAGRPGGVSGLSERGHVQGPAVVLVQCVGCQGAAFGFCLVGGRGWCWVGLGLGLCCVVLGFSNGFKKWVCLVSVWCLDEERETKMSLQLSSPPSPPPQRPNPPTKQSPPLTQQLDRSRVEGVLGNGGLGCGGVGVGVGGGML